MKVERKYIYISLIFIIILILFFIAFYVSGRRKVTLNDILEKNNFSFLEDIKESDNIGFSKDYKYYKASDGVYLFVSDLGKMSAKEYIQKEYEDNLAKKGQYVSISSDLNSNKLLLEFDTFYEESIVVGDKVYDLIYDKVDERMEIANNFKKDIINNLSK